METQGELVRSTTSAVVGCLTLSFFVLLAGTGTLRLSLLFFAGIVGTTLRNPLQVTQSKAGEIVLKAPVRCRIV